MLSATFNSQSETTTLSWVNYNQLNAGELPEVGPDALTIRVWRHTNPLNRSNGFVLSTSTSTYLVASLSATNTQFTVSVPENIQRSVYYSVTYYLPNHLGQGPTRVLRPTITHHGDRIGRRAIWLPRSGRRPGRRP